jgi:hypothetical protein
MKLHHVLNGSLNNIKFLLLREILRALVMTMWFFIVMRKNISLITTK